MSLPAADRASHPRQPRLPLATPDEHGEVIHCAPRHGTVLVWQQRLERGRWVKIQPDEDLARALAGQVGQSDRYISANEFHGWRLVKLLRSLRACYVDLDSCRTVEAALFTVDDVGLPRPSYAVHSGRGVHLYWLLEAVPAQALPVWQAIQARLIAALDSVGADKCAGDCTRVLRLAGTVNSRTETEVLGYIIEPGRWTLHQLADEVLGHRVRREASVASLERARAVRRVVQGATGPYQLWHGRYVDLCAIADHHGFMRGGVPEGHRDMLLFLLATALSWFTRSDTLGAEIRRVARTYVPDLTDREAEIYTRPIIQRSLQAADGGTVEYRGQSRDPRYHFRTETIREWLGELITPDVEPKLRVLLPRERLQEREHARQKDRDRVKEGRYRQTRAKYLADAQDKSVEALRLRAQGLSVRAVAARTGLSKSQAARLTK